MDVDCEGCAGCCLDWRPLATEPSDHERRGSRHPLDDAYNFVPLTGDEVRGFVDGGYGDALTPRLWHANGGDGGGSDDDGDGGASTDAVTVDGIDVAAIDGRPAFFVGLRTAPKPVAPFGRGRHWLRSCVFLDPETLQCRIHGDDLYPGECADYPGHNLALGRETECERVEAEHGGERLLDRSKPSTRHLHLRATVGAKVFTHPSPERIAGAVGRIAAGASTPEDRAAFVAVAAGSRPGTTAVDAERVDRARERVLAADSWVGRSLDEWTDRAGVVGDDVAGAVDDVAGLEERRGAPETPGW